MKQQTEDRLFVISMWWRIGYGVLRIILGLAVLKVVGMPVIDVITTLLHHELVTDPQDALYSLAHSLFAHHPLYISYFMAFYLIFWGVTDVFLSYHLMHYRRWAFPVSLVLIGGFVCYELFRFSHTHSLILLGVMCIDTLILWLVYDEYKKLPLKEALVTSNETDVDHTLTPSQE